MTSITRNSRCSFFLFQAEDGIRDYKVTGVQTCALPISWIDAVGQIEALLSIATYAYEHPTDIFPQFSNSDTPLFDGEELGHPLIPAAECIRNSAHLGAEVRMLMVSGSNMSGKSTLLRTIGINTVMAMAG